MVQDWHIQHRAVQCAETGRPFEEGEFIYTLLLRGEGEALDRIDLSEAGWKTWQAAEKAAPFCFWRAKFQPPAPPTPEALPKENAETLLRQYLDAGQPEHARACYILALMLERKRILRPIETTQTDDRPTMLVYEHAKSGETFVVTDPKLKLDQLTEVQTEVSALLAPA